MRYCPRSTGRAILGAILAAYIGFSWHLPAGLHLLVALLGGLVGGGFWGGLVGWLKARAGAHGGTEVSMRLLAPPDRVRPAVQAVAVEPAQPERRKSVVERSVRSSSSSEVGTA